MYSVYFANLNLKEFTRVYLDADEHNQLFNVLSCTPKIRPYWGNLKQRYIIQHKIYFLYEVDDVNQLVLILGVKFNNDRKTFNFARTPTQIKTIKKWIQNKLEKKY
ncbi:hypothetical protein RYD26_05495 [Pasteurellaceae bacterium LIM206]|nr:hypothetical protein [Pasteurellaceae bacterium LIM206]